MTTTGPAETPAVYVRPAERSDLLDIYRIETDAFDQPWPFDAFEQYVGESGFLVAVDDGVLGFIVADVVSNEGMPIGHIKDLAVHRESRRSGIGSLLLDRAIEVLEDERVQAIRLEVREGNEAAVDLYRNYGFTYRQTIDEYYDDGEDALLLVYIPSN